MAKAATAARKPFVYEETALERAQSVFYEACEARTAKGRIALAKKALAISPLCAYLLGEKPLPKTMPPFISPGGLDEAIHYAAEFRAGWLATPGALDWMRTTTPASEPVRRSPSRKPKPYYRPGTIMP